MTEFKKWRAPKAVGWTAQRRLPRRVTAGTAAPTRRLPPPPAPPSASAGAGLLTNDATVREAVAPLALPLAVGALLTAPVAVCEGVLLARRQLRYLAAV